MISGYSICIRRDRNDGRVKGGVIVYVRVDIADVVVPTFTSDIAERV